jgi:subtilisin family serine protease
MNFMRFFPKTFIRLAAVVALVGLALWLIQLPVASGQRLVVRDQGAAANVADSSVVATSIVTLTNDLARKFQPALLKQWLSNEAVYRVLIQTRPVIDNSAAPQPPLGASILDRRRALVNDLQSIADRSQAGVWAVLDRAQLTDRASEIRSLWINNSIAARVDRSTLIDLAKREDVIRIDLDQYQKWIDDEPISNLQSPISNLQSVEWNIAKIRADQVWSALGISGTGVVVANMDTGVDGQHPALQTAYRGYNAKGLPQHVYSWFDATPDAYQYPYDGYGHGTHTMGTLVGSGGIGVAPGAKWIAVRVLDSTGSGYDSWIHAGFQWILAPGGDPDRAPDVLSNSWGNANGNDQSFRNDVKALNAAGIATFFSNGNSGPSGGSVGSPASLPEAFGVGATNSKDVIASFSSRGPSPFNVVKPDVSAPGVNVRSSYPGGTYQVFNGTSMAAPHVAGVAALMLSAMPSLTITATRYFLTSTAIQPITSIVYPNNDYGWGRVDAFAAVLAVAHSGVITGVVTRSDNAAPIGIANLHAQSIAQNSIDMASAADGTYSIAVAPSVYTLTASAFGYLSQTQINVMVLTDTITRRDFSLTPLPTGSAVGHLIDLTGTQLVSGSIEVVGTPIAINAAGVYSIALPAGVYVLRAQAPRHRIVTATIAITVNQITAHDFLLPSAPAILLIDGGIRYSYSVIPYYEQALTDLNYLYTEWPLNDYNSLPTTATLRQYPVVIWSAPFDSPGYVGADALLDDYLAHGGHFFLSGQDVAYWDNFFFYTDYFSRRLLARYADDDGGTRVLIGQNVFAGQVITISGSGGANNQFYPDAIESTAPLLTQAAFDYAPDQSGGQSIGLCQPYRAVFLAYGFEAINDRLARAAVLSSTFGYFDSPRVQFNYALDQVAEPLISAPGGVVSTSIDLHNLDEVAPTTLFSISVSSAWPASITPTVAALTSCMQRAITLTVDIPVTASIDARQMVTITAHPIVSPALSVSSALLVKAPASVLLVDDDRWYPVDQPYRDALSANHTSYDLWRVPTSWSGPDASMPDLDRLDWYSEIMWFTGYDWYQTLTSANEQMLLQYLSEGGRVLLSSQGYLDEHGLTYLGQHMFGILDFTDTLSTTTASGPRGSVFDGLNFGSLNFPYPNFTVALAPQMDPQEVQVALIGSAGWPIALTNRFRLGKSLFMSFGFEDLPSALQPEAMNRIVGYLSWLGDSQVQFDRASASAGDVVTATIVAMNDMPLIITQAAYTITVPLSATLKNGDPLTWSGSLLPHQSLTSTIVITLNANLNAGDVVTLPIHFSDQDHALQFVKTARVTIDRPTFKFDLNPTIPLVRPYELVTWTLVARNHGIAAPTALITALLPFSQSIVSGSLAYNSGTATYVTDTILWNGSISTGQSITLTYQMRAPFITATRTYYGGAVLDDGLDVWQIGNWVTLQPYQSYLPLVRKG